MTDYGAQPTAALLVRVGVMAFYYIACFAIAVACYLMVEEPARRAIQRATCPGTRSSLK